MTRIRRPLKAKGFYPVYKRELRQAEKIKTIQQAIIGVSLQILQEIKYCRNGIFRQRMGR